MHQVNKYIESLTPLIGHLGGHHGRLMKYSDDDEAPSDECLVVVSG